MIQVWRLLYNTIALPILVIFGYGLYFFNRKVRHGVRGRRRTMSRIREFKDSLGSASGPIYWFHASSLGEFEQCRPVIEGLKEIAPEAVVVVSFFSPSGYENSHHDGVDFKFYLPFDLPWSMRKLLRTLQPHKVIFASYDIWPNLIWSCYKQGISTTLFAARVVQGSSKQWPILSNFFRHIYRAITHVYTVSAIDRQRLLKIIGNNANTKVKHLGDPRYDRVNERSTKDNNHGKGEKILILGSLHKDDHDVVCPVLMPILHDDPTLRVLWAPHETHDSIVEAIGADLDSAGVTWGRYEQNSGQFAHNQVLIIDGIGYLADIYSRGILAYVGGGFGHSIHNVMEPAIAAIPVLFGPKFNRSNEAEQLIANGGGISISNSDELKQHLKAFLADDDLRKKAGRSALKVITDNLGASARILRAILGS